MNPDSPFDQELDCDVVVPVNAGSKLEAPVRPVESVDDFKKRLASLPPHDLEALIRLLKTTEKRVLEMERNR